VSDFDLNPDRPHSPERTAELGDLFDQCSRAITYATMARNGGLDYPADAYRLLAELYSATGRFPQICEQLGQFLAAQQATGRLYEARGRDIADQVGAARADLDEATAAAQRLTRALRAVQADIAGLGVREDPEGNTP
jgi:hypothetical protein